MILWETVAEEGSGTGDARGPQLRQESVWVESTATHGGASVMEQAVDWTGLSAEMSLTFLSGQGAGIYFWL